MTRLIQVVVLGVTLLWVVGCKSAANTKPVTQYTPPPDNGKAITHMHPEMKAAIGMNNR